MAFKLAELFVAVKVDMTQYNASMASIKSSTKSSQGMMKSMGETAKKMFMVAGSLMAGASVAGASYEKSIARIRAITRVAGQDLVDFEKVVRDLGTSTVYSAKEIADAAKFLAVSGFSVNEIMEALPSIMNLAAAGMISAEEAANDATRIMRGMGITAGELGGAVDMMAKAFTSANTDMTQFSDALSYVGPIARFSNISLNEVGAAIMVVSNAGIQAERAGTGLRRFLAELSKQASPTATAMRDMGVSVMDSAGQLRSIPDIIEDMTKAMNEQIPEAQRLGKLMEIFGLRSGPAVAAMMADGGKSLRDYEEVLRKAGGTAKFVADTQINTLWGEFKLLKNAVFDTAITMGEVFRPVVSGLISGFKSLHGWFKALTPETKNTIGAFITFAAVGSALYLVLMKVVGALVMITAHPLVALLTGIAALATYIWYAVQAGDTMGEKFQGMWNTVATGFQAFIAFFEPAFKKMWDAIRHFTGWLVEALPGAWETVVDFVGPYVEGFAEKIGVIFKGLWDNLSRIMAAIYLSVTDVWTHIKVFVMPIVNFLKDLIVKAWDFIGDNVGSVMSWIYDAIVTTFSAISFAFKNFGLLVRYVLFGAAYHIVKFANQIVYFFGTVIPAVLSWFFDNFVEIFKTLASFLKNLFVNIGKNVADFMEAIWSAMKGDGFDFDWTPLMEGFENSIKEWPGIAKREIGATEKALGDHVDKLGKRIAEKWERHNADFMKRVKKTAKEIDKVMEPVVGGGGAAQVIKKPPIMKPPDEKAIGKVGKKFGAFAGAEMGAQIKKTGVFFGLEEMGRKLQQALLGEGDIQKLQLKQLEQINKNLKKDPKDPRNILVGP